MRFYEHLAGRGFTDLLLVRGTVKLDEIGLELSLSFAILGHSQYIDLLRCNHLSSAVRRPGESILRDPGVENVT